MEETSSLLIIWDRILNELSLLQDKVQEGAAGHIMNPVIKMVYPRETAFAAKVFAVEYKRSGKESWLQRAKLSIGALQEQNIYTGMAEPLWKPREIVLKKGSIPATASLLDSFWSASSLLGIKPKKEDLGGLLFFLKSCYLGKGLFAHDAFISGRKQHAAPVQNTTAMALFLMEAVYQKGVRDKFIVNNRGSVFSSILKGQRSDGFWPYIYPGCLQQYFFRIPLLRGVLKTDIFKLLYRGDKSILFGDSVHHCYVFYYLLKAELLSKDQRAGSSLDKPWAWIKSRIKKEEDSLYFDFGWEPKPLAPRYCNFRDTTTYFMVINICLLLEKLRIISKDESQCIISGLLKHIERYLLNTDTEYFPCINPYEGPSEVIQNILPRAAESVAWKGALLADLILEDSSIC